MTVEICSEITINDLSECGYAEIIASCEPDVEEYFLFLSRAARELRNKGDTSKSNALELLSATCSLMLRPSDPKTPFAPIAVSPDGTSSFKPTNLSSEEGALLAEFISEVQCPELAARLADLVWIVNRNRSINSAKIAIASYIKSSNSSFCQKNWQEKVDRLERALRLSILINDKASIESIKNELITCLDPEHEFFSYIATKRISNLLLELKLIEFRVLGEKILSLVEVKEGNYEFQYDLLSIAAQAFIKEENYVKADEVKIKAAEALLKKVEETKKPGQMLVASHWLSQAISVFQKCKDQQQRISDLQEQLELINKESLKERKNFSCSTDITDMSNKTILAMQNKNIKEAIIQFAYLIAPLPKKELEKQAIEIAKNTMFQSTIATNILNGDGRLVAIIPPLAGSEGEDYDLALKWRCYRQAFQHYSRIVHGVIMPAKNELLKLHQINENLLTEILRHCAFFPPGRAPMWIKGFVFGFYNDFDSALSLLIPQFEHALRKALELRGAIVWRIDPATGFHSEKTLGTLLDLTEAKEFLGEDLQFELQGLLSEKVGFNFRNESTHGLASQLEYYSPTAVYLWWLFFHIVVYFSQFSSK